MRFSVGIVPCLYMLVLFAIALEYALVCFGFCEEKCFAPVFLEDPTLFGAADRKLSSVDWPSWFYLVRVCGDLIYKLGRMTDALTSS